MHHTPKHSKTETEIAIDEHGARTEAHRWLLPVLLVAQLMVILDITAVNIALPHIATDLNLRGSNISWAITSYSLVFGSLLLFGGRAADLLGRRRMFLTGLGIFTASSFASAMAGSATTLFAARAGQGLGAAIVSPAALAIITTAFTARIARRPLLPGARSAGPERQSASWSAASSPSSPIGGRSSTSTSPSPQCCSSPR